MPGPLRRARPPHERQRRAAEWEHWFRGECSATAYEREVALLTGLPPDIAWPLVDDLAELLIGSVPATLGIPAMLAITILVSGSAKPREASRALLTAILAELEPAHARAVLESLALAWHNSRSALSVDERRQHVLTEATRVLRRLRASEAPGIDAVEAILSVLD
ncbi:MAG: hypothetical protein RMJ05_12990 [Thermomicrobium sp.]|jgi:hypothetical protein|nr:hypothetical protein [Thermomicrobium sp.]MDW8007613.1 hypothetical protein [Thermomicrobium sp.]